MAKERVKFVLEWERRWSEQEGVVNVSELCREFGISRECGHKWIRRYRAAEMNLEALEEKSRRPHHSPTAVGDAIEAVVVEGRKLHPRWGPIKLRGWLQRKFPNLELPGASTIAAILKRRGLVRLPRRRARRAPVAGVTAPFPECAAPNAVWCVDFSAP